jgi:transcriptional regulator with XRE-family HTH domain
VDGIRETTRAVGARIRQVRHQRGLLLKDVAKAVGCSITTISDMEVGERMVGFVYIVRAAQYLSIPLSYLTGDTATDRFQEGFDAARARCMRLGCDCEHADEES